VGYEVLEEVKSRVEGAIHIFYMNLYKNRWLDSDSRQTFRPIFGETQIGHFTDKLMVLEESVVRV
jgi:hypothetical protein